MASNILILKTIWEHQSKNQITYVVVLEKISLDYDIKLEEVKK